MHDDWRPYPPAPLDDQVEHLLEQRRPGPDEYRRRLSAVRHTMAEHDWTALVVSTPANIFYLSGYDAWSFYTPQCLIVPADGPLHLFARAMDAAGAQHTSFLALDQIHGYPEDLVHRPDRHPFDWIAEVGQELGVLPTQAGEKVAVEANADYFTARCYLSLVQGLPGITLVDSHEAVNWVRLVKSDVEIEQMEIAGEIATSAMKVALEEVEPGRKQSDVVGSIFHAQVVGTADHGGDYPAIVPMLPTGAASHIPHLTWTDTPFVRGEATTIELAGVFHRYHVPAARTVMLGKPSDELVRTAGAIDDCMHATLDAVRSGVTAHEVHQAFDRRLSTYGLTKDSRCGYSIGVAYPPDWGEQTVSLRAGDLTELQAGMTFHVILGMWTGDVGYELSQSILVEDSGARRLTDLPTGLTVKES